MPSSTYTVAGYSAKLQAEALEDMICDLYGQGNAWMQTLDPERKKQAYRDLDEVLNSFRVLTRTAGLTDER